MAALYGKLRGRAGEVTRTRTKSSEIMSQVQTCKCAVRVHLTHDDKAVVLIADPSTGRTVLVWQGNAADVLERGTLD